MHTARHPVAEISLLVLTLLLLGVSSCRKQPALKVVMGKEGYMHTVAEGETLEAIAVRYYGDAGLGKALGEYNSVDPTQPLEPGRTVIVPFDRSELEKIRRTQEAYVLYNKGTVLARTGQYEEALKYLELAIESDSSYVDAWYNLGLLMVRLDRAGEAETILTRLANSFPSDATYRYSLGVALRDLGRRRHAIRQFEKALSLDPDYAEAQYALALTLEQEGETDEARRAWERYLEIDPDSIWSEEARVHLDRLDGR
jgi:tetratricopeptide (TPR) repeat protein